MKHTPTPWIAQVTSDPPRREFHIKSRGDRTVARYLSYDDHLRYKLTTALPAEVDPNARRIVACVNACEGIDPEAVPELSQALLQCLNTLADVKKNVRDDSPDMWQRVDGAIEQAEKTIAKITAHTHVASDNGDQCKLCGHDLRHDIHKEKP